MSDAIPTPGAPMPPPPPPVEQDDAAVILPKMDRRTIAWCQEHGFAGKSRPGARNWLLQNPDQLRLALVELGAGDAPEPMPKVEAEPPPPPPPAVMAPDDLAQLEGMATFGINQVVTTALRRKRCGPAGGSVAAQVQLVSPVAKNLVAIGAKYGWLSPAYGLEMAALASVVILGFAIMGAAKITHDDDAALAKAWGERAPAPKATREPPVTEASVAAELAAAEAAA